MTDAEPASAGSIYRLPPFLIGSNVSLFPGPQEPDPPAGRRGHPYFMHDMIVREPTAVQETLRSVREVAPSLPRLPDGARLYLIGQGTSFHAALAAAPAAEEWLGRRRSIRPLSSFDTVVSEAELDPNSMAIVFSASGETAVTILAQEALRRRKIPNLLITHTAASGSADRASHAIVTRHAEEASWTHTVSYVAAITAAFAVFEHWAPPDPKRASELGRLPAQIRSGVEREEEVRRAAETLQDRTKFLLLGSGPAEATVREAALKLREAAGRFTATVGVEEALHGALPSVDDDSAVIALARAPIERERAESALRAARLAGARTLLLAPGPPAPDLPSIAVPEVPSVLSPVVDIVPFQWIAYWSGLGAGRNPDIMGLEIPRIRAARSSFGI
ncbi:MAG: SIS domain-containing protein [Thermoplasmata archaeon]